MWKRREVRPKRGRDDHFLYQMIPMAQTPTASEHGEWLDSQYELAWNLWLWAHQGAVSLKDFVRLATQLDETPEAGEYFRWLCQYELWCLDWGIPFPVNYLKSQWFSNDKRRSTGIGRSRRNRTRRVHLELPISARREAARVRP